MKKSNRKELTWDKQKNLLHFRREKNFEIIKGIRTSRKRSSGNHEKKMPAEKFEMWKKKAAANKPKPKPIKIDDFDEDLDGKYYIKTN
jgi:hypothetical protein